MDSSIQEHNQHYAPGDVEGAVLAALSAQYGDDTPLTIEDLTAWDQFHSGGLEATHALMQRAKITASDRVLDVGGGFGGSARLMAHEIDCHVTVLDLTEAYCRIGEHLTARTNLTDRVEFRHGNALALPFDEASFDVVWTQHSSMNFADKAAQYAQIHRVLRPGGRLAQHEVTLGSGEALHYPVPWARSQAATFLEPPDKLRELATSAGFHELEWTDITDWTLEWFQGRQWAAQSAGAATSSLGLNLLLGSDAAVMGRNFFLNAQEGKIRVIQGVFERL